MSMLSVYLIYLSIYIYLCIFLSLSLSLAVCVSIYLHLSTIYLFMKLSYMCTHEYLKVYLRHTPHFHVCAHVDTGGFKKCSKAHRQAALLPLGIFLTWPPIQDIALSCSARDGRAPQTHSPLSPAEPSIKLNKPSSLPQTRARRRGAWTKRS